MPVSWQRLVMKTYWINLARVAAVTLIAVPWTASSLAQEALWLPAPKEASTLTMRIYSPKSDALTGKWSPPAAKRAQ
jgi:hypothetical protein